MTFGNKLSTTFRTLRWSTLCVILIYIFFIGLILHSTINKFEHTLRSDQKSQMDLRQPLHFQQMQTQQQPPHENVMSVINIKNVQLTKTNTYPLKENVVGKWAQSSEPETVILAASSINEKQILAKVFQRADKDHDEELSIQELAHYINYKIIAHIDEAIMNNAREFKRVDIGPTDGLITWDEYHRFFLREHGMTEADIDEHDEIKHTALNRKAREEMMRDKARWSEAARTDLFTLTIDEYLSFRHPESSVSNLLELVDDLLRQFDQDGDDQLTIEEFSELNINDDDDLIRKSLISKTLVERCVEFKRIIDKNHDGKADRSELLNYVNPKTPRYALQEAVTLFNLCDENKDGSLTINELVAKAEIFLSSKMIDTAHNFHTEF